MRRIVISLREDVVETLKSEARKAYRDPREHAAFIIETSLRKGQTAQRGMPAGEVAHAPA